MIDIDIRNTVHLIIKSPFVTARYEKCSLTGLVCIDTVHSDVVNRSQLQDVCVRAMDLQHVIGCSIPLRNDQLAVYKPSKKQLEDYVNLAVQQHMNNVNLIVHDTFYSDEIEEKLRDLYSFIASVFGEWRDNKIPKQGLSIINYKIREVFLFVKLHQKDMIRNLVMTINQNSMT